MKWWNEYNNIVTLEFPGADLKKLNLNKVVSELYSNKISVICAFANSYYPANVCYYNSNILEKHIDLGEKDLLKENSQLKLIDLSDDISEKNFINTIYNFELGKDYPYPIVKHEEARKKALDAFKRI